MIKRQDLTESREIIQMEYEGFVEQFDFYLDLLVKSPEHHGRIMNSAVRVLGLAFELNLEKEKIIDLLELIKEFGRANFISTLKLDVDKNIVFQKKKYPFNVYDGDPSYTDPEAWRNCVFAAIILRDHESLNFFISIPAETHHLDSTTTSEQYHKEVELLKDFFDKGIFDNDYFDKHFNIKKSSFDKYDFNYITKCIIPFLSLLKNISDKDEKSFNKNLETALLLHKEFWTSNDNDRYYDSEGWVSLPILAATSFAFDKGFSIEIESEYAPLWLIKKEYKL